MSPSGKRVFLLGLTLVPPLALLASGWPLAALLMLLALHLPLVFATLYPHSTWFGPVVTRLPAEGQAIWLTIDDGPSPDTAAVLDLLDEFQARATFFLVSERAKQRPDLVTAIRARGHDIGNHSATHPAARFWCLGPTRMAEEIGAAQRTLQSLTGARPRWFRSVAGHTNPFVAPSLIEQGLARVSWSARGYDAVSGDPEQVARRVSRDLRPGAIVLLHEGAAHGHSVAIIRRVLETARTRGLHAVLP
ncbi:MAG: polysaccharide deacetylase family protein [Steroidobacteraceae bacterium]